MVSTASRSRSGCPINSSPGAAPVRAQTWTFWAVCIVRFGAQQECTGGRWLALFGLCAYGPCSMSSAEPTVAPGERTVIRAGLHPMAFAGAVGMALFIGLWAALL